VENILLRNKDREKQVDNNLAMAAKEKKKERDNKIKGEESLSCKKHDSKKSDQPKITDVEQARAKAAQVKEQSLKKYREKLKIELDADKARKLNVVNSLFVLSLLVVWGLYFLQGSSLNPYTSLDDFINDMLKDWFHFLISY